MRVVAVCLIAYCSFFLFTDHFQDANHYTDMTPYRYGIGAGLLLWLFGAMFGDKRT